MKKSLLQVSIIIAVAVLAGSCKKNYHCQCSYNNQIRMVKDLGKQTRDDAQEECDTYDSTVTGEKWNCVLY